MTNKPDQSKSLSLLQKLLEERTGKSSAEKLIDDTRKAVVQPAVSTTPATSSTTPSADRVNTATPQAEAGATPTETQTPAQPEAISEPIKKTIERMEKKHNSELQSLGLVYALLKNHVNHTFEEDDGESLLKYLGFDETNLTEILIAIFGPSNTDLDEKPEIEGLLDESKSRKLPQVLYEVVLQKPSVDEIDKKVDRLAERIKELKELMAIPIAEKMRIKKVLKEIQNRKAEKDLRHGEQTAIAKELGVSRKAPRKPDEAFVKQKIVEIFGDGRERDFPEQANQEQHPEPAPAEENESIPEPPDPPQASAEPAPETQESAINYADLYANASPELLQAIGNLNALFMRFRNPDEDCTDLTTQINDTDVGRERNLGFVLFSLEGDLDVKNIFQLLIDHLGLSTNEELIDKILEIDTEFSTENIYS